MDGREAEEESARLLPELNLGGLTRRRRETAPVRPRTSGLRVKGRKRAVVAVDDEQSAKIIDAMAVRKCL